MLLALTLLSPAHASVNELASREGWLCTYGAERTVCTGPSTWAGVEAIESVSLCGADESLCAQSWSAELEGDALWGVVGEWTGALSRALDTTDWVLAPTARPGTWHLALRSKEKTARLELEASSIRVTIEPRPPCPPKDELLATLEPLLLPLAGIDTRTTWPAIDAVEHFRPFDEATLATVRREVADGTPPADLAQRTLIASEPFACLTHGKGGKHTMKAVDKLLNDWYAAIGPDAREKRIAAREAERRRQLDAARQVDTTEAASLPEEE